MGIWKSMASIPLLLWQVSKSVRRARTARNRAQDRFIEAAESVGVPSEIAQEMAESYPEVNPESMSRFLK